MGVDAHLETVTQPKCSILLHAFKFSLDLFLSSELTTVIHIYFITYLGSKKMFSTFWLSLFSLGLYQYYLPEISNTFQTLHPRCANFFKI